MSFMHRMVLYPVTLLVNYFYFCSIIFSCVKLLPVVRRFGKVSEVNNSQELIFHSYILFEIPEFNGYIFIMLTSILLEC
jgi:hypothetical protein